MVQQGQVFKLKANESPGSDLLRSARLPVIAHIGHGYGLREIATHLGCSVTTFHRRVHACGDGRRSSSALAAGGTKKT